jgi:hypothetical protein
MCEMGHITPWEIRPIYSTLYFTVLPTERVDKMWICIHSTPSRKA